jgi:hypothetical protein
MLTHLAECTDCRKAVFLMQPHEHTQAAAVTPAKGWAIGWMWRRLLLPVWLPATALACALIAVLVYIRPHGSAPQIPEQSASVRQPEIERPATTVVPTPKSEPAQSKVARSGKRQSSSAPGATSARPRQENPSASGSNLLALKNAQATANGAPQTTETAPAASSPASDATLAKGASASVTLSDLRVTSQNVLKIPQPQPGDAKGAASQNSLAKNKDLPALEIESANGQVNTLAGVSGRVMDRSGAIIPGATVTLTDTSGKTRQTTTATDGSFRLTDLPAGQYELIATANGFATRKQPVELKPREVAMLQPVLDVGAMSETVTVTAGSPAVQTEPSSVSGEVMAGASAGPVITQLSRVPVAATVSRGKRFLSLDSAGNLFLSRNGGKKWKKINPQWAGKAVRIELTPASMSEGPPQRKNETSATGMSIFHLTTDAHAVWTSKDGKHWHQQ